MPAWPSHVALALLPGGNEKSGFSTRSNLAAFAPVELGQSSMSAKRGRTLFGGFCGGWVLVRCDAASSMQPSVSSPHWKLFHISAAVALCHDGQGLRKPATLSSLREGRVRPGE